MSRPREHTEDTAAALLDAAERIAEGEELGAVSVRRVATETGTTTRAVYSLFGSKDGLVTALGVRAFNLLGAAVAAVPRTADPATDLVEAGLVFQRFAREHPALFRTAIQLIDVSTDSGRGFADARGQALAILHERIRRLSDAGRLGGRRMENATWEFHALCEGLASLQARCLLQTEEAEYLSRDALSSLIRGWGCDES